MTISWLTMAKTVEKKRTYCKETPTPDECKNKEKGKEHNVKTMINQKTTVINSASATASASITAAEVSTCKLDGNADGIQQKFNPVRYQACGLYPNAQIAYTDGFVMGCTQIGNTQLICQSLVDSSILNTKTQPTQATIQPMQTQTQLTHEIQPTTADGKESLTFLMNGEASHLQFLRKAGR